MVEPFCIAGALGGTVMFRGAYESNFSRLDVVRLLHR